MHIPTDARAELCRQLLDYRNRHPERADIARRILRFVATTPDCFSRSHLAGHITGSAWLLHPTRPAALLTLHRKLRRWLQPGGHADGDPNTLRVALREATEESGIPGIRPLQLSIFDVDIHRIPARPAHGEAEHLHYDIRYLLQAPTSTYTCSDESEQLAWWTPAAIDAAPATFDEAVHRLRRLAWG